MKAMTPTEKDELIQKAFDNYHGYMPDFESAVGFFHTGFLIGWKPLYLLHSKRTVRKYEQILSIKVREYYDPVGEHADRLRVWTVAKSISNFWKLVSGELSIEKSKYID